MKLVKVTRWYDDACGTAHALELVGERWSLLVMRELMFGPRRFAELRRGLPGISANVLTQRLGALETAGVLRRRTLPPPASVQVYELTQWGYEAEPAIQMLGRWAARSPGHDPTLPLSAASLMMSFRTMVDLSTGGVDPSVAGDLAVRIGFRFGADGFTASVADGSLVVERGEPTAVDALVTATPEAVAGVVYGGAPLDALTIEGDARAFKRFARLFTLPSKAVAAP
jgi:DNA-binding HxlR family transcriptional regulator